MTLTDFAADQVRQVRRLADQCRRMTALRPDWSVVAYYYRNRKRLPFLHGVSAREFLDEYFSPGSFS